MTEEAGDNIGSWLIDNVNKAEGKSAVHFEDGRSWSYGDLDRWSDAIAVMLGDQHGVGQGDRVAYLGFNHPAMIALLFACARLGAILVPLNWRLTPNELAYIAVDCGPKALFFGPEYEETAGVVCSAATGCTLCSVDRLEEAPIARLSGSKGSLSDPLLIIYT
ncbi:MAG: AMP-binding protein, partial [Aestuariivirgaceae bacterium]